MNFYIATHLISGVGGLVLGLYMNYVDENLNANASETNIELKNIKSPLSIIKPEELQTVKLRKADICEKGIHLSAMGKLVKKIKERRKLITE